MSLPKFDPSLWNLSLPVGLLLGSACGPKVPFEEDTDGSDTTTGWTETDTVPGTWSSTSVDTTVSDTATSGPTECIYDSDCPYNYYCSNGRCYYGGCLDGCCYDDCCYEGCYYDCYAHEECGQGGFCYYGGCSSAYYTESCGIELGLIPLPEGATQGALSLAFVDADGNGDAELVQARSGGFEVDFATGAPIIRNLSGVQPTALAVADFTGDGIPDLVFADEAAGRLTMTRGLGNGSFQFVGNTPGANANAVVGGDFDGDGFADVVTTDNEGNGRVFVGDGLGGFSNNAGVPFVGTSFAAATLDPDATYDIVVNGDGFPEVLFGGPQIGADQGFLDDTAPSSGSRLLAASEENSEGSTEVAALIPDNRVVFPWVHLDGNLPRRGVAGVVPGFYEHIAIGDVDGNTIADIVLAGTDGIAVMLMSDGIPLCTVQAFVPHSIAALAVGDIDNDGRAEIAVADEFSTTVLTMF